MTLSEQVEDRFSSTGGTKDRAPKAPETGSPVWIKPEFYEHPAFAEIGYHSDGDEFH